MITITQILLIGAFIAAIAHAIYNPIHLWISVILLCVAVAVQYLPK